MTIEQARRIAQCGAKCSIGKSEPGTFGLRAGSF
jgi:hypothetical protein